MKKYSITYSVHPAWIEKPEIIEAKNKKEAEAELIRKMRLGRVKIISMVPVA